MLSWSPALCSWPAKQCSRGHIIVAGERLVTYLQMHDQGLSVSIDPKEIPLSRIFTLNSFILSGWWMANGRSFDRGLTSPATYIHTEISISDYYWIYYRRMIFNSFPVAWLGFANIFYRFFLSVQQVGNKILTRRYKINLELLFLTLSCDRPQIYIQIIC